MAERKRKHDDFNFEFDEDGAEDAFMSVHQRRKEAKWLKTKAPQRS